jgi:hypothetical protein
VATAYAAIVIVESRRTKTKYTFGPSGFVTAATERKFEPERTRKESFLPRVGPGELNKNKTGGMNIYREGFDEGFFY